MGLKAREKDREESSLGLRGTQREVWHLPHPLSSLPGAGERGMVSGELLGGTSPFRMEPSGEGA